MHLIWYNSVTKKYEYGSSLDFKSLKESNKEGDDLTILMEFTRDDKVLALKIIGELNIAKSEPLMVV
ncbi:hypothetical protein N7E81_07380 [Reichenbachiella carrageenanivorans]|uniref:DUF2283 domain-containing protein n=1 Tax=Reichenbachiella carrageenanivorans TaxID=2979869 RepID=A0ABY6D4U5_9BACT|nr:hypothetical protein [Reichenbachiella carrageenanivorans]UXX80919.1 hypothetical protein N7E81_07380 [Reichenbachiella carrageenanivorans]